MFTKGRRWLSIASLAMVLVAGLHTAGQFASQPEGSAFATALAGMQAARVPMGAGMEPSVFDLFRSLAFTMSVTVVALGVLGLAVAADREAPARLLWRVSLLLALVSLALSALFFAYRVTPPLVSFAIVFVLYVVATVKASAR